MVTEEVPKAELIATLDPEREYGDLSYDEVVAAIQEGEIKIRPGIRLPVLRDDRGRAIKGTGHDPLTGEDPHEWTVKRFRARFVEDFDRIYAAAVKAAEGGEPRAMKLLMDHGLGRPKDPPHGGNDELMQMLLNQVMAGGPHMSSLVYETPADVEVRDLPDETEALTDGMGDR